MNAVMHKYDLMEDLDMPTGENDNLALQVAELRADVRHIQSDVTDIKAERRLTNQRLESLRTETTEKLESLRKEIAAKIDSLRKETAAR